MSDQEVRRTSRRRRLITTISVVIVIGLVIAYCAIVFTAPAGAVAATAKLPTVTQPAAAALVLPQGGEGAVSVAGADDYLGAAGDGILASSGGNGAKPIASISKLITALVVLDKKPLTGTDQGPPLTFDKADADLYDKYFVLNATVASMKTGSSMSEHDAIETMLVASACNYAEAVSDWAYGSQDSFISAVKSWLKAHNLSGTSMVESTGVDARNTSTPSDLIAIGKLAMANPVIASMVNKTVLDVPSLPSMVNTNDLLGVDGVNGIKTGTLDSAGSQLLFSASVSVGTAAPLTVVGVVLGGTSRESVDSAAKAMIASIKSGFHQVSLIKKGTVVGTYSTAWGSSAKVVAGEDASVLTWSNTPITSKFTTRSLTAAGDGDRVGTVTWTAGKTTVTVPLLLQGAIIPPDQVWRLTHPGDLLKF